MSRPDRGPEQAPEQEPERGTPAAQHELRLHATTVALTGAGIAAKGLIILGPSGSGKSALALQLMSLGATLVADDYTILRRRGTALIATAPDETRGMIEARGVGLLSAESLTEATLALALDLGQPETARLPPRRVWSALGAEVTLLHAAESAHFPAALMQYLRAGRSDQS